MTKSTILLAALMALPALGQDDEDARSRREEILAAIRLPASAQALRNKGVSKAEVKEALRAAKGKRLNAKNAKALLDESAKAVDENGNIDNFGKFVKSKLAQGLRGRDLAAAIHAEHKQRGKGKGKNKSKGKPDKDKSKDKGKPDKDKSKYKGKPDKDKSKDKGKPDKDKSKDKGKPDKDKSKDKGKPDKDKSKGKGK